MSPRDATVNGDGFRFYHFEPDQSPEQQALMEAIGLTPEQRREPTDCLSVTAIRALAGLPFQLVNWQIANVVNAAMGVRKQTRIGPRGGVSEVYVKDGPFPGEFITRMMETRGAEDKLDVVRKWVRETADDPRDIAAVRGSVVHKCIEFNLPMSRLSPLEVRKRIEDQWAQERRKIKPDITDDDVSFVINAMRNYWHMRQTVPFVILAQEPQVFNLCHAIGTKVLTRDLRWVAAEDLAVGDQLWAFSEGLAWRPGARHRWEPGEVTATRLSQAETVRITMASGRTLTCTLDHPLHAMRRAEHAPATRTPVEWVEAQHLRPGDVVPRYLDPWDETLTRDAGWLAGIIDGEGHIGKNRSRVTISQNEGPVAERMRRVMRALGLTWSEHDKKPCIAFTINGSVAQNASLLGALRPSRLLPKFNPTGQQLEAHGTSLDTVVSVESAGVQTIVNLTTSTKTYFADGYGSHNTVGYAGSADVLIWFLGTWEKDVFTPLPGVGPADVMRWQTLADAGTVTIEDIAKVGGELTLGDWKTSKDVYCVEATTPVLTDDLRWVEAGSLREGDGLWAFTEDRVNAGKGGRRWERSVVEHNELKNSDTVRIVMESGRVLTCTPDHPLLARRSAGGRNMTEGGTIWLRADELRPGNTLPHFLDVWAEDESREAGWFAGLLDGEGCLHDGRVLSFAQKEGIVAERARAFMRARGIAWTEDAHNRAAIQFSILGDTQEIARILGSIRPSRLLPKFRAVELQTSKVRRDRILRVELAGVRQIASLTTSTGTFFSDGYGSHNTGHVVQGTAYLAAQFVGGDGKVDARLTAILRAMMKGAIIHIRPNGWTVDLFDMQEDPLLAFIGSAQFARFLARFKTPHALFTASIKGVAPDTEEVPDAA